MALNRIAMGLVALTMAFGADPVPVYADGGDIAGGIIGGVIGGVIVNEGIKSRERQQAAQQAARRRAVNSSYVAQQNRETQTALNYFGFAAGTPDGVLGRNSRMAISQYQAYMGNPASGYLNDYERNFLVSSYQRAIAGGPYNAQLMQKYGQGTRGLLIAYRDEANGTTPPQPQQPQGTYATTPPQPQSQPPQGTYVATPPQPAPAPMPQQGTLVSAQPQAVPQTQTQAAPAAGGGLPTFGVSSQPQQASMASFCNQVSLVSGSNGGFVTAANMKDPKLALSEQFCVARTYAIQDGETLISQVRGTTQAQIDAQCKQLAQSMQALVAGLGSNPPQQERADVAVFIGKTGQATDQLSATGRICLSSGYRTDAANVATAAALLMVGLGDAPYGELLGAHLLNGFGTPTRNDLAMQWYNDAVTALEHGAKPVFAPGDPSRVTLLREAIGTRSAGNNAVVPAFSVGGGN